PSGWEHTESALPLPSEPPAQYGVLVVSRDAVRFAVLRAAASYRVSVVFHGFRVVLRKSFRACLCPWIRSWMEARQGCLRSRIQHITDVKKDLVKHSNESGNMAIWIRQTELSIPKGRALGYNALLHVSKRF